MKRRKAILLFVVAAGLVTATTAYFALQPPDAYHTPQRRAAKADMIGDITADLAGKTPPPAPADDDWMNEKVILCVDGSWLAYRSHTHKENTGIYDIFIAKGSDGQWGYSTFHFCKDAMVLASDGQPESLAQFREKYSLAEFDGKSDIALEPTWPPKPEERAKLTSR